MRENKFNVNSASCEESHMIDKSGISLSFFLGKLPDKGT